jgi:hypothetical protein
MTGVASFAINSERKRLWPIFGLSLLASLFLVFFLGGAKAHANTLNPDPGGNVPAFFHDYLANCNSSLPQYNPSHSSPALVQWVADSSGGQVDTIEVQPGNNGKYSVQYILAGAVCFSNNAVNVTYSKIISANANTGTVSNAVGQTTGIVYPNSTSPGSYDARGIFFDYDFGGPITTTQNITFTIQTTVMNHFTGGANGCVTGTGNSLDNCTGHSEISVTLTFHVPPAAPQHAPIMNLDDAGNCSIVKGWGFDQDVPSTGIKFHAYLDGASNNPAAIDIGEKTSNIHRQDVNDIPPYKALGVTGDHGFNFSIPDAYKFANHDIYIYAIGQNTSGAADGTNAVVSGTYIGCPPEHAPSGSITAANCATISGTFTDADSTGSLKVIVYFDGGNATTVSTSGGNWSATVPVGAKHTVTTAVTAYGYGKNVAGTEDSTATALTGATTIGPCKSAACNLIQGSVDNGTTYSGNIGSNGIYTVTQGVSFKMKLTYLNTAPATGGTTWTTGSASGQNRVGVDGPYSPSDTFNISPKRLNPGGGSTNVAPGETAYFVFSHATGVSTPPGDYTENFHMVEEANKWYVSNSLGNAHCQFTIRIVQPPPVVTCTLQAGGTFEVGAPYTPKAVITHTGPTYAPSFSNLTVAFSVDGSQVGTYGPSTLANGSSVTASSSGNYTTSDAGTHTVSATVAGTPSVTVTCANVTVKFSGQPYFKVYGADVITGNGFSSPGALPTCSATSGNIYGFASGSGVSYRGSATQFGAIARGNILGFFTSGNRATLNTPPKGLSFSNTASTEFGGNYGAGMPCITDYFSDPASVPKPVNGGTRDKSLTAANGRERNWTGALFAGAGKYRYLASGNTTIAGLTVPAGHQAAIYINGNLTISGDISFDAATSTDQLPNLAIIVRGNIYITPNVKRIDGLYVAQPNNVAAPTNGKIYTCANAFARIAAINLATTCGTDSSSLAINGALVAQEVKFLRTMRSVSTYGITSDTAPSGEVPDFANGSGAADIFVVNNFQSDPSGGGPKGGGPKGSGVNTYAAEVINYTAEMYLAPSAIKDPDLSCVDANCKYDSIYSLPPIY